MEFEIVLIPEEEGGFYAIVPSLPGCASQGESESEAIENAREAIRDYLEVCAEHGLRDFEKSGFEAERRSEA